MPEYKLPEEEVFKSFAKLCPYGIVSFNKRYPPEPDMICQIRDGSSIAFELTESIYNIVAKRQEDSPYMKFQIGNYLNKSELKQVFEEKFKNAFITIYPHNRILSRSYFRNKIGDFIKFLIEQAPEGEEFHFPGNYKFVCEIVRGNFQGPIFDTDFGGDFNDCVIEELEKKFFQKVYSTCLPIELLVFYHMQPGPIQSDIDEAVGFIKENLVDSPFRRVWIYSIREDNMLAIYPEI